MGSVSKVGSQGTPSFISKESARTQRSAPSGIELCPENSDFSKPDLGVGISVDGGLKNVSFFVVPGTKMFFGTDLLRNQPLTPIARANIIQSAMNEGIFTDIQFYDAFFPSTLHSTHQEEYIARYVFGTDYAMTLARNLYCIHVPMSRPIMKQVVNHLNELNSSLTCSVGQPYRGGKKKDPFFHWHGIYDNCTHTPINALAAIGALPVKKVNLRPHKQIFHLAIPANTLLDIHRRVNLEEIDVDTYFKDPIRRKIFEDYAWIPQQPRSMTQFMPIKSWNKVYRENDALFTLPHVAERRIGKIHQMTSDPRFTLKPNLKLSKLIANHNFYIAKYNTAIKRIARKQKSHRFKQRLKRVKRNRTLEQRIRLFKSGESDFIRSKNQKIYQRKLEHFEKELEQLKLSRDYVDFVNRFSNVLQEKRKHLKTRNADDNSRVNTMKNNPGAHQKKLCFV